MVAGKGVDSMLGSHSFFVLLYFLPLIIFYSVYKASFNLYYGPGALNKFFFDLRGETLLQSFT